MKIRLRRGLVIALLLAAAPVRAADPDPWFGHDKALHFSYSAGIAAGGYGASALFTDDRRYRMLSGAALALTAGVAKEALDYAGAGDASARDLTWDLVGTVTGVGVAYLADRIICHFLHAR
jgi:putative lipoprotein